MFLVLFAVLPGSRHDVPLTRRLFAAVADVDLRHTVLYFARVSTVSHQPLDTACLFRTLTGFKRTTFELTRKVGFLCLVLRSATLVAVDVVCLLLLLLIFLTVCAETSTVSAASALSVSSWQCLFNFRADGPGKPNQLFDATGCTVL